MSEKWSLITNWGIKFSGGIFHDLPCVFRLNSFQVNKKTPEQDEKDVGFTVIRVESSVSTEDAEDNKVNADNDAVEEANAAVTLGDNNENENSAEKEEDAKDWSPYFLGDMPLATWLLNPWPSTHGPLTPKQLS